MDNDADLISRARACVPTSYSPYSKFSAAAIASSVSGHTRPGVIVENVSLGLAMCAERVAMFGLVADGHMPSVVALAAPKTAGDVTWPCGACLQVALELGGPDLRFIVGDVDDGPTHSSTVSQLLPNGPRVTRSTKNPGSDNH